MNPMMNAGVNMANMQAHMANSPPHLLQVSPNEIAQIRANRPAMANYTDDQIRLYIQQMKRQSWMNQTRMRSQSGVGQGLGPQNPMAGQNAQMGQQQNQPPNPQQLHLQQQQQQQPQAANRVQLQQQPSQQPAPPMPGVTPAQAPAKQQPTPQQSAKNLKRPSTDDAADNNNVASMNSAGTRGTAPKKPAGPTPQQIANLTPEQRAKYEMWVKTQVANKDSGAVSMAPSADAISKLKAIGQEAQRQALQEPVVDYPMSQQELEETGAKLRRIVIDMGKVGRGLSKWFAITGDEGRASMFFKFRLRLVKQFVDGESMNILRDSFSMRSSDLEQARAMLESMARDLMKSTLMKAQNSQQAQVPQGNNDQSPPPAVAPLNATNLEKNTQALNRQQKNASKAANQPPPAPTVAQAPGFPTNASSPHGNPNYMSRAKDMHLQIPPRKKQKVSQQPGQAASTPSPRVSKTASPEVKRATEPLRPVFLCKEADCDMPSVGFPTEQALKQHVEEEHIKPKEDPVKFVQENLALVLGLEKDGAVKSTSGDSVQAMGAAESKQGHDAAMKRSGSALSRVQSGAVRGENGTPNTGAADVTTPGSSDPWATATIDTQALLSNLGFENGLPTVMNEFQLYRSLTPNDTPESSKDSGASEPNSDISETAALEIDMNWQHIDTDLLLDLNNTNLGMESTLDPSLLLDPLAGPPPDWDDITVDFNKPFQFDTSRYSFNTL
ncbi:hypothetical protein NQ176_g10446 [Zarea fungicola]|uniref:Uncharacterized protein n=1 Tax=Zarea fungicola TaxID=93591 RepID=A0ACC1MHR2_9HYPO|nr:hypothetical protein NQ176_g10446 [Lecanicillium fungicola]